MDSNECRYYAGGICRLWTSRNGQITIHCGQYFEACKLAISKNYNNMIKYEKRKDARGGAREGSGRKRQGEEVRRQFSATIDSTTAETIRKTAGSLGTSNGAAIDEIVRFYTQNANR